jgi:nickel-dependent lactate racemase
MRTRIAWGQHSLELDVREHNQVPVERAPIAPDLADPAQTLRDALDQPLDYPPLRLALTPDDHIAIAVDEGTPHLVPLLVALLEHIREAKVQPEAITLICTPPSTGQPWLDELPDEFQDVQIEVHQPGDRKKLAYLAATKDGRAVYLNRTAVDADQLVILSRRRYDARFGYAGAETMLYPTLSNEATLQEVGTTYSQRAPGEKLRRVQAEAREITWMAGAPFFVQLIEGNGDALAHIVTGPLDSSDAGQRLLDARWRLTYAHPADVVIASISGDPARQSIDDLARAAFAAMRVVKPGGSIVLLSEITPTLGPGFATFGHHDDPALALRVLQQEKPNDLATCYLWATAADHAKVFLLSGLAEDVAEELFAIPMQQAEQAQRLLTESATCILLPDAHRTLAVLA